jgi:RND family efflux transporter MFP subunit
MQAGRLLRQFGAAVGVALAAAGCGANSQQAPHGAPPVIVRTATVERRTVATYETLDGVVDPYLQSSLAPQQSGTLVQIYANEGDRVAKGEVLAKIDDSTLQTNLQQQQGNQTQAAARLAQSQIQLPITSTTAQADVIEAERTLAQGRKQVVTDRANVANTAATFDADRQLLQPGYVSITTFQQARAAYVAAQQTLRADEDKLVADQAALAQARSALANVPLQQRVIEENRGAVTTAQGSVAQYRTAIGQTVLTAPFDGVVTSRTLDPGAFASPNQAIYQISQIDPVYVDFNVKDTDLAYVHPGTLVSFTASSQPGRRYSGSVFSVNAVPATGTLLYRARIVEPNPDFSLRGGVLVSVRVTTQLHPNVLCVPRQSIVIQGNRGTIYAVRRAPSSGTPSPAPSAGAGPALVAKAIEVTVGLATNAYIEVRAPGLEAGETIVAAQPDTIRDGARLVVGRR